MRALVATRSDPDDPLSVLELRTDWPEPDPQPGWTVIRVAATSINAHDIWSMRGVGVRPEQFPMVLGCDITGWDTDGNEVIVHSVFGDPDEGDGDETFDPGRLLVSERFDGAFAELVIAPRRSVLPKPSWLSFHEAACLPVAWLTAYRMLFTRAAARPGQTVLVQGAGGGVATAAIVLARHAGLFVYATSRSPAKQARALEIGAHVALDDHERLPETVDLVVDTVGEATWQHSLRALKPGGRIVSSGSTTGSEPPADLTRVFYRQLSVIGSTGGTRGEMRRLLRFMEAADIHPVIDSVHSFDDILHALDRAQHSSLFGKVIVDIASR